MPRSFSVGVNFGEALNERKRGRPEDTRELNPLTQAEFTGFNVFGKEENADFHLVVKAACGSVPEKRFPIHRQYVAASASLECILEQTGFMNANSGDKILLLPDARWMAFIDHLLRFLYAPNNFDVDMACFRGGLERCIQVCFCGDFLQLPEDPWWTMFYEHMKGRMPRFRSTPTNVPDCFWFLPEAHFLRWLKLCDWHGNDLVVALLRWFSLEPLEEPINPEVATGSGSGASSSDAASPTVPIWEHRLVSALNEVLKRHPDHVRVRCIYREYMVLLKTNNTSYCPTFRSNADLDWPKFPVTEGSNSLNTGLLIWQPATTFLGLADIANLQAVSKPFIGRLGDMMVHWFRQVDPWCRALIFQMQHFSSKVPKKEHVVELAKYLVRPNTLMGRPNNYDDDEAKKEVKRGIQQLIEVGLLVDGAKTRIVDRPDVEEDVPATITGIPPTNTEIDPTTYWIPRTVREFVGGPSALTIIQQELEILDLTAIPTPGVEVLPQAPRRADGTPNFFNDMPYDVHLEFMKRLEDPRCTDVQWQSHVTSQMPFMEWADLDQHDDHSVSNSKLECAASMEWKNVALERIRHGFEMVVERLDPLIKMREIYLPEDHPERKFLEAINKNMQEYLASNMPKQNLLGLLNRPGLFTRTIFFLAKETYHTQSLPFLSKQYWQNPHVPQIILPPHPIPAAPGAAGDLVNLGYHPYGADFQMLLEQED